MMVGCKHINSVIIEIKAVNFKGLSIAKIFVTICMSLATPDVPPQAFHIVGSLVLLHYEIIKIWHRTITDKYLNDFREFFDKMRSCYSSNWSPVNSNIALDLDLVNQELQNSFGIHSLLIRIMIWCPHILLTETVASIIPRDDITFSPQEKVKPVGVRSRHHPLINHGIWIVHYDCGFLKILTLGRFKLYFFTICAREE